jgi:hypothetical protein
MGAAASPGAGSRQSHQVLAPGPTLRRRPRAPGARRPPPLCSRARFTGRGLAPAAAAAAARLQRGEPPQALPGGVAVIDHCEPLLQQALQALARAPRVPACLGAQLGRRQPPLALRRAARRAARGGARERGPR